MNNFSIVGIIGMGFVGDALAYGISQLSYGFIDVRTHDVKYEDSSVSNLLDAKIIFVCVPTPMRTDGSMNYNIVKEVLTELAVFRYRGLVVIKSTTMPTVVSMLVDHYPELRIATNPEFLRERSARKDFVHAKFNIIGVEGPDEHLLSGFYKYLYRNSEDMDFVSVSPTAAMMAKYMANSFFAVKVAFMNECRGIWREIGPANRNSVSWESVVEAVSADERFGLDFLLVPGPDGEFGFGGKCFPKDLNALISAAKLLEVPRNVMEGAWKTNNEVRQERDWLNIEGAVSNE